MRYIEAPWKDYNGNTIMVNDTIVHPSGQRGKVVYHNDRKCDYDQWCVDYNNGFESRLCLQVGEKGRAVVENK